MQQRYLFAITAAALFLFTACQHLVNPSGKLWFYTHSTGTKELPDSSLTPASFIDLEKDGSYTSDFGHFDYGKWVYSKNEILLISYQHNKSVLPVSYLTDKEMQTGPAKGPFDNFESQPVSFASGVENPFSKENNGWRVKADAKETDSQIKNRLLNHFKFWELYFTWAFNDNIQYIDVRSTPTLLKIYGNGFALKPFDQLPAAWKLYFYDEEDCRKANEKIKYMFDNNAVAWPHTENKYKMFISAFQQLQQKLK
ncbi:MAG TPA: hypothetical protein VK645_07445 [Chitinophagaceae bacterium]|nr:hypothetical protein [Chitinophagaceae bacterium]